MLVSKNLVKVVSIAVASMSLIAGSVGIVSATPNFGAVTSCLTN